MTSASTEVQPVKPAEIRKVRRVATGILIFLTLIFAASFTVSDPPTWLLLVRAMAEAGMVGGLADWFAVEALFRRPLGLPIPHTALLPNNQKRAAGNIARFIDEYFLVPEQLLAQVGSINPVRKVAEWLVDGRNASILGRELSHLLHLIVKSQLRKGVGETSVGYLRDLMLNSVEPRTLSEQITKILKGSVHSRLLDDILLQVRDVLDQNRDKVLQIVQDRSRWWIASSVDKRIVAVLVDGILSIMDELADADSGLRTEFEGSVTRLIERFQATGQITSHVEQGLQDFADSPQFARALDELIAAVLAEVDNGFTANPERVTDVLAGAIHDFAQMVLNTPDTERQLNDRLLSAAETVLEEIRPAIVTYITHTIAEWDSDELVTRMEAEVGRDLQFIRINGAVLGSIVGGVLFCLTHFFFNS